MKCLVAIAQGFRVARDFNRQLRAIEELKIPMERLDYWHGLFRKLLSNDKDLALEWLQYACDSAVETLDPAREHLNRVHTEIVRRVGAGEEKPKPPETMAGKWWKERDDAQARQDRTTEEVNRPA